MVIFRDFSRTLQEFDRDFSLLTVGWVQMGFWRCFEGLLRDSHRILQEFDRDFSLLTADRVQMGFWRCFEGFTRDSQGILEGFFKGNLTEIGPGLDRDWTGIFAHWPADWIEMGLWRIVETMFDILLATEPGLATLAADWSYPRAGRNSPWISFPVLLKFFFF